MKKKILIVGGTGFLGYHLAKKSLQKKWSVTSISLSKPKKYRYLKKVKYIICDISKKESLKKKLNKNFDYVVNLGGHVDHSNKKKTYNSHYEGCKNLASFFLKKRLNHLFRLVVPLNMEHLLPRIKKIITLFLNLSMVIPNFYLLII